MSVANDGYTTIAKETVGKDGNRMLKFLRSMAAFTLCADFWILSESDRKSSRNA